MGNTQSALSTPYLYCEHCRLIINEIGIVVSESVINIPFGASIAKHMNDCRGMKKRHSFVLPDHWDHDEEKLRQRLMVLTQIVATHSTNIIENKETNELPEREPFLQKNPNTITLRKTNSTLLGILSTVLMLNACHDSHFIFYPCTQ
eukprot:70066_1